MPAGSPARGSSRIPQGSRRSLGRIGEDAAIEGLRARGYRIIERNVRLRRGELDVIAEEGGDLVFVEVKARRSSTYALPRKASARGSGTRSSSWPRGT